MVFGGGGWGVRNNKQRVVLRWDFMMFCVVFRFKDVVFPRKVGVISPYKQQIQVIREMCKRNFGSSICEGIEFNTVDGYQGREVDIVIFSTVRASTHSNIKRSESSNSRGPLIGFVGDIRRMNVAITRAKYSLWILGHEETLRTSPPWAALLDDAKKREVIVSVRRPYLAQFHIKEVGVEKDRYSHRPMAKNKERSQDRSKPREKRNQDVDKEIGRTEDRQKKKSRT